MEEDDDEEDEDEEKEETMKSTTHDHIFYRKLLLDKLPIKETLFRKGIINNNNERYKKDTSKTKTKSSL
jgi:hypothetical protein